MTQLYSMAEREAGGRILVTPLGRLKLETHVIQELDGRLHVNLRGRKAASVRRRAAGMFRFWRRQRVNDYV